MTNHELLNAMQQAGRLHVVHVGKTIDRQRTLLKSRRFALVIGNELHVRKYEDPSHGWLAVPMQWLEALNLIGKVSAFSYHRGGTAYLEEDCDAPMFRRAAETAGFTIFVDYRHTNYRSAIRSYDSFTQVIAEQYAIANQIVSELIQEGN